MARRDYIKWVPFYLFVCLSRLTGGGMADQTYMFMSLFMLTAIV